MDNYAAFVQYGGEQLDHVRWIDCVEELGQIAVVRNAGEPFVRVRIAHLNLIAVHFVVYIINLRLGN